MRARTLLTASAVAAAACGTFGEASEATLPPSGDAGTTETGSSDGSIADAPSADSNDGAVAVDCPAGALWCENFENGLGAWTAATSPPFGVIPTSEHGNVLLASFAAGTGTTFMTREIAPSGVTAVRLSFSLRVKDPGYTSEPANANYAVAAIQSAPAGGLLVALYLNRGAKAGEATAQVTGASAFESFVPTTSHPITYGTWHRFSIETTVGVSGSFNWMVDQTFGGNAALKSSVTAAEIALGAKRPNSATPAVEVAFDDVFVEKL